MSYKRTNRFEPRLCPKCKERLREVIPMGLYCKECRLQKAEELRKKMKPVDN